MFNIFFNNIFIFGLILVDSFRWELRSLSADELLMREKKGGSLILNSTIFEVYYMNSAKAKPNKGEGETLFLLFQYIIREIVGVRQALKKILV